MRYNDFLAVIFAMREYGEKEHIYSSITNSRDKQDEIFDVLEYKERYVVDAITTLARYYYDTNQVVDYGAYIHDDKENTIPIRNPQYLYTLIQYGGEDILIHVGTGEFTPEVFTRRDIPQIHGLSHSPLPLFVVDARSVEAYPWEENEILYKKNIIRKFLNEYANIYSPKGGDAQERTISRQGVSDIDYGMSNGIIDYKDAMMALQNAIINNICKEKNHTQREKFIKEIEKLQGFSKVEFLKKAPTITRKYHEDDEMIIFTLLKDMVDKSIDKMNKQDDMCCDEHEVFEKMYANLKIFDIKHHIHHQMKH